MNYTTTAAAAYMNMQSVHNGLCQMLILIRPTSWFQLHIHRALYFWHY